MFIPLLSLAIALMPATVASTQAAEDVAAVAVPASPPTTSPAVDVAALIAQLSSDDWSARQAAQDQLVAAGSRAVDALRAAIDQSSDEEVRQRGSAALALIAENDAVGPSMITLHEKDVLPRQLFADLSKQSGVNLEPYPSELWDMRQWPTVSIDIDNQPFWTAMRALTDVTGIDLRQWNDHLNLMQSGNGQRAGRVYVSGPFQISLLSAMRTQSINYGVNEQVNSNFQLTFAAMAEPKLGVLRSSYLAKIDEATDDQGNSLLAGAKLPGMIDRAVRQLANRQMEAAMSMNGGGGFWNFTSNMDFPLDAGRRLALLRGSIGVVLRTASEAVEVPDLLTADNVVRLAGGWKFTVLRLKKVENRYELPVSIAWQGGPRVNSGQVNIVADSGITSLKLFDAEGKQFPNGGMQTSGNGQVEQCTFLFNANSSEAGNARAVGGARQKVGEPAKAAWRVATEMKEIRVPFEFKDVPLPTGH